MREKHCCPPSIIFVQLFHGSVTKVIIKGDGDIRVQSIGSVGFMPEKLQTYSNRIETAATQSSDQIKPEVPKSS